MNWRSSAPPAALLAASAAVYWPATRTFFVGDDWEWLHIARTTMGSPVGWLSVFIRENAMGTYRPLTENIYFWLCWHLFGAIPLGFHLVTLTVFLTTVWAVWRMCAHFLGRPWLATGVAALFVGCTAVYEMLDWSAAFSEVGAVACMAWGALAFITGRRAAAAAWCAVAVLCDETAMVLPLLLLSASLLAAPWPLLPALRRAIRETRAALGVFVLYVVVRFGVMGTHAKGAFAIVLTPRILAAEILRSMAWTFDVTMVLRNVMTAARPEMAALMAVVGAAGLLALGLAGRRADREGLLLALTGAVWWIIGLLPVLPVAHDFSAYNLGAALLGVPLFAAGLLRGAKGWAQAAAPAMGVAFLLLGTATVYGPGGLAQVDGVKTLATQARAAWVQLRAARDAHDPGTFCAPESASWTLYGQQEASLADPGSTVIYGSCPPGGVPLRLGPG